MNLGKRASGHLCLGKSLARKIRFASYSEASSVDLIALLCPLYVCMYVGLFARRPTYVRLFIQLSFMRSIPFDVRRGYSDNPETR